MSEMTSVPLRVMGWWRRDKGKKIERGEEKGDTPHYVLLFINDFVTNEILSCFICL